MGEWARVIDKFVLTWNPKDSDKCECSGSNETPAINLENVQQTCDDMLNKYEAIKQLFEQIKSQEFVLLTDPSAKIRREQAVVQTRHLISQLDLMYLRVYANRFDSEISVVIAAI